MTLKLIHDAENVSNIPVGNLLDIGGMARRFADEVDAGRHGQVSRVILMVEDEDGIRVLGWGARDATPYELMGLFEAAKLRVFADDFIDD